MSKIKVSTNNVPRDLLYWCDLSPSEQEEVGDWATDNEDHSFQFFRYKGQVYCFSEMLSLHNSFHCPGGQDMFPGWDGYESFGFVGGIVAKNPIENKGSRWERDTERVIVGRY